MSRGRFLATAYGLGYLVAALAAYVLGITDPVQLFVLLSFTAAAVTYGIYVTEAE